MENIKSTKPRLRIPEILQEKGWTASDLMRKSGLAWPTAQGLASGKSMNITLDTIHKLCDALEVDIKELIVIETEG